MSRRRRVLGLAAWLAVSFVPAGIGAFFRPGAWYEQLDRPTWTPPDWLFGPVWTLLYALMGVAAWLVWQRPGSSVRTTALVLFGVQLVLNAAWTPLFFGMQSPGLGLIDIVLLWGVLVATIVWFWRVNAVAAGLLIPYLLWVTYAAALNAAIWAMN